MLLTPRDYQDYGIEAIFRYFGGGATGNPLLAYPTGTGKSLIIGGFIERVFQRYAGQKIIVATHVKELIAQNYDKLKQMWPLAPAGIYSAGLNKYDTAHPIIFAGIQSIHNKAEAFGKVTLLIVDEAHLISPGDSTEYKKFIADLKQINPYLKIIGLTATKWRTGQGLLTEGDNALFTDIIVDCTTMHAFNWFISEGYLCNLIPKHTSEQYNLENIKITAGEYNEKQMQAEFDKDDKTYKVLCETLELSKGRQHGMIFAAGVKHVENVAHMLADRFGETVTFVHSKMKAKQRDQNIEDFKAGKYRWMVNNGILTTGFDFPALDVLAIMRATNSTGLWVQMLGRLTRPFYAPGHDLSTGEGRLMAILHSQKPNGLVLDFAANTGRLGPINDPVIPKPRGKGGPKGVAPVRICDNCGVYNHSSAVQCTACGTLFPRELKISEMASTAALIKVTKPPEPAHTFQIDKAVYEVHTPGDGRPASLRVTYYCGLRRFKEWVALEQLGKAHGMAKYWWKTRAPATIPLPGTVEEALKLVEYLRVPVSLDARLDTKYPTIINFTYLKESANVTGEESPT